MKLQHPDFPDLTKTIESKATANKWLKSGWVEVGEDGAKPKKRAARKATAKETATPRKRAAKKDARGGPVENTGQTRLVGEQGPETIVPPQDTASTS